MSLNSQENRIDYKFLQLQSTTLKPTIAHFVRALHPLFISASSNASALCLRFYDANDDSTTVLLCFYARLVVCFEIVSKAASNGKVGVDQHLPERHQLHSAKCLRYILKKTGTAAVCRQTQMIRPNERISRTII